MRKTYAPRAAVSAALGLLFTTFTVPALAAVVFGTITFDDHELATELAPGPYLETAAGVTVSVTFVPPADHIHLGDWDLDGSPDLYNHAGITQRLTFSQPVNILGFDVVDEDGGLGAGNNSFVSSAGGTFSVVAGTPDFFFDVTANGSGVWAGITSFDWTQASGGDLTIDNLQFSAVPLPAAFWLGISGLVALSRFARAKVPS